jgi:acyl carrier protein phosphodiesterase
MNFLAHLYLSGDDEEVITGNFIADHVKGDSVMKYNAGIRSGIRLHREIDAFTDSHPVFLKTRERLNGNYRKYAGVVADMFYDHFLSADWKTYSDESLDDFTDRMHSIIIKRFPILPDKSQRFIAYMKKFNWFTGYGTFEGLNRALNGMSIRTPFKSGMENAVQDLKAHYNLYREEFQVFFPEITQYTFQKRINF